MKTDKDSQEKLVNILIKICVTGIVIVGIFYVLLGTLVLYKNF